MKFTEVCIKRPVFTTVLSLVLIVVGVIGFLRLPVRALPNIDRPVVSIHTNYPGASAQLVETSVTTPIENVIADTEGIDTIKSQSEQGQSRIWIHFKIGTNLNQAADDVRNKVMRILKRLPQGIDSPVIEKSDSDASDTVIFSITDAHMTAEQISDYANRYIIPQLQQLPGVASVDVYGDRSYAMRIWLNPWKMAVRNVSVPDVMTALANQNQDLPGGQIKSQERYYSVLTQSKLNTPKQFNDLVIREHNGYLLRLSDVGQAVLGPENVDDDMRVNGITAMGLGIIADSTANPIDVAHHAIKKVKQISRNLPDGMKINVVVNNIDYVHASLKNLYASVIAAILLVILVIALFLGSIRTTLIPVVTIPVCLISVFGFLYAIGFSINFISLLALVLAIGLVVDDAIVMLENIYRHIENGMQPFAAAIKGSKEIAFAIVAMTLTLAAVYAPISFARGLSGIIFAQFAFTLAMAVIISGFIALTLSPMMCSKLLVAGKENNYKRRCDQLFQQLIVHYQRLLIKALNKKTIIVVTVIILAVIGVLVFRSLPTQLAPLEDQGIIKVRIEAPTNASFRFTNYYTKAVENIFKKTPAVKNYTVWVGGHDATQAFAYVVLKPWSKRDKTQQQLVKELDKKLQNIPGVKAVALNPAPLGSHEKDGGTFQFMVMSTDNYRQINNIMQNLKKSAENYPGLLNVGSTLKMNREQFQIVVNRNLAASMQVNMADIAKTIATMLGGTTATTYNYDNYDYDVIIQMKAEGRREIDAINHLFVRNAQGKMIPLSALVTIKDSVGPLKLFHFDRLRAAEITAQVTPGYTMGEAVKFMQRVAKQRLPQDTQYAFVGAAKRMLESRHTMQIAFLLAMIFIYLVLAAQFESFIDPLIILLSVPLSIVGALVMLKIVGGSLNIYSEIGLITLVGLIAKHGILITEFANQLRQQGVEFTEAIIQAATKRLRPILMTTAAMVIGALPLAFATGAGAHGRQAIGWVIVGGLLFGTFFSLFVVPVAYAIVKRRSYQRSMLQQLLL